MRRSPAFLSGLFLAASAGFAIHAQSDPAASPEFFETKIRPILASNCYSCHTSANSGGLRLDSGEALLKGGNHGPAVVVGNPDKSLLMTAVRQTDANLKMPMGGKLKDSEIADLAAWIKAGTVWPKETAPPAEAAKADPASQLPKYEIPDAKREFWSFVPIKDPAPPQVKDPRWNKTPIDRFVYSKMEQQGLKPVAAADKRDLIRRATMDLIGLPATPEEIEAFEKDNSPDAFAKVVDRLLASPHYGESWGRVWMDVARYGEDDYRSLQPNPKGYRPYPNAYAYRDWVINAFNDDMPYSTFIKAQLAGDLMDPKMRYKMLPATGFLGLGPWYYDNGSAEVTRADERHDRVDAVTRGFLGLTVACARCHNHKYDPIPQTDYYALAGVFYNTTYEEYPTTPKSVVAEYEKLSDQVDEKNKVMQDVNNDLSNQLSRTLALQTSNYLQAVWQIDGSKKQDKATVVEQRKLDYELLDRWVKYMEKETDKYHNKDAWQAMMKKKNSTQAEAKRLADKFQEEVIEAELAKDDIDAQNQVIKDKDVIGTKPKKRTDKPSNFVTNRDFNPGSWLRLLSLPEEQNNFYTEIFQRELKDNEDVNAMMAAGARQGNPGVLMFRGWGLQSRIGPDEQAKVKEMQDDINALRKKLQTHYPFIHGVMDAPDPKNIQLAIRGNPENPGPEVPRHFLSVLSEGSPEQFSKGSGRAELADDIVRQPLAMRVVVNRIWKEHFGTGIVDTPSNFGQAGERPTNPELLEYLASDFVKNGMSIKKLQREIMLTQTYQLSTRNDETDMAKDSGDRYYWRATRKRLTAEELRDSVLAVAGNLDTSFGGPSEDLTPSFLRRTLYGRVSRYKLDTYLQTFDFPPPNISAEKRFTTTVPLQRLFLMNSDFMQIESEQLAKRVASEPDNRARIKRVYEIVFGRQPSEMELSAGLTYLHTEPMKEYEEEKNKPKEQRPGRGARSAQPAAAGVAAKTEGSAKAEGTGAKAKENGAEEAGAEAEVKPDGNNAAANEAPEGGAEANPDADPNAGMGMGMMAGVGGFGGRRGGKAAGPDVPKYDATAWGRYAKVLLSSSEFLFTD